MQLTLALIVTQFDETDNPPESGGVNWRMLGEGSDLY